RDHLRGQPPFRVTANRLTPRIELAMAPETADSPSWYMNPIETRANGALLPLTFLDTGAQNVVMTTAAAGAAGVEVGMAEPPVVGSANFVARPALLKRLELGSISVENVPVLVGDSPPLLANRGQMLLGVDLMQHVRFTIDYPRRA